jgi:hypothetical protein
MSVVSGAEPTFAGPLVSEPVSAKQQWERKLRADIESTLQEAMRTLRFALESRLQQELNAGLANALHDASPAVQQALVRRVGSWSAQLPPPQTEPWAAWIGGLLDAAEPPRILSALFAAASALAPHLAIYVVRGPAAIAWRCSGIHAPARMDWENGDSVFRRAISTGLPVQWRPGVVGAPGAPWGPAGAVYPLSVRGKTIALLCHEANRAAGQAAGNSAADAGVESRMAVLARVASLSLEQAMHQGGGLALHAESALDTASEAPPAPAEFPVAAPEPEATLPAATAEEPPPSLSPVAWGQTAATEAPAAADAVPEKDAADTEASSPSVDAAHAARARRFAKVLAQDLELYLQRDRPGELAAAREQRDLYGRLQEDLDKCRQSFLERYPADSGLGLELLDDQLIAILAQGDAAMLGPAYPRTVAQ